MKRQTLTLLIFSVIVIALGALLAQAALPTTVQRAAAVGESAAVEAASIPAEAIETICRQMPGQAAMRFCLSSNNAGRLITFDGTRRSEFTYAFVAAGEACPPAPQGLVPRNSGSTAELLMFGYTQVELDLLGLGTHYCMYGSR